MSEEIKEIIDKLKGYENYKYRSENGRRYKELEAWEIELVLDYITNLQKTQETLIKNDNEIITNLQEEKQRLLESADCLSKGYSDLEKRIDKAIEVIDLITPELWNISNNMTYRLKDIKNILRGDE